MRAKHSGMSVGMRESAAEDDAGVLVLGNRLGTGLTKRQQTVGAIGAHAGEECRDNGHTAQTRERIEQLVNGWTLMVQLRSVVEPRGQTAAVRLDHQVMAARCDIGHARLEHFPARGLNHANLADAIEAFVNPAGMCCAITMGGVSAGIRVSSDSIACGPPVDAPIAMTPCRRRGWSKRTDAAATGAAA
jgi:hypothetical protein